MKIFWSWQSDTPGKTGRFLIRDALKEAVEKLRQEPDVEEPVRELHLDQDMKNVAGSPGLVATIFDKIQRSVVVVADVTLVGEVAGTADTAAGRKKLINSNVAIELGYALCHLTDQGVLLVFNKHYGSYEELPFDLRHRGGAVFFDLSPNANREDIESERKKLTSQFVEKLKPYLQKPPAPIVPFPEIPSTYCKAAYFDKGEILATREPVTYKYSTETLGYLRLIPTTPLAEPLNLTTLEHAAQRAPLLGKWKHMRRSRNKHGAVAYEPVSDSASGQAELGASTQLFENGELWSVSATLVRSDRGDAPVWMKFPLLPMRDFEAAFYDTLRLQIRLARELGVGAPWRAELGLVGTNGLYLGAVGDDYSQAGPIHKIEVVSPKRILNDETATGLDALLLEFFTKVYDAAGFVRPARLFEFPVQ